MRYYYPPLATPILHLDKSIKGWSITRIMLVIGTALVTLILLAMSIATYRIAGHYLNRAYARNALTRTLGQAHELNTVLKDAREELLFLARTDTSPESIRQYMMSRPESQRIRYREVAFHGQEGYESFVLLNTGEQFWRLPRDREDAVRFPAFNSQHRQENAEESVQIEQPAQVYYSSVPIGNTMDNMEFAVIRMTKQAFDRTGRQVGIITLSLDIAELQRTLSIYSSENSPLYIFPQDKVHAKSFFFDASGWLIMESGASNGMEHIPTIDTLRSGLQGDVGRPGFGNAFRPAPLHEKYWTMVSSIQSGKSGQLAMGSFFSAPADEESDLFLNYAPIVFTEKPGTVTVIGGIGSMDSSFLFKSAIYDVIVALAIAMLVAVILTLGTLFYLHRRICSPVIRLTAAAEKKALSDDFTHLALVGLPKELLHLQHILNVLQLQLQTARNEASIRQGIILDELQRQPVHLDEIIAQSRLLDQTMINESLNGIVGGSPPVRHLRSTILKAANVMADVLIIGETGTGKELTAEAIHKASDRANGPFISINCGALDENLLLDALFGHVKGAFSEAKTDRKGAFLAASGGTLHLDEIGNASAKVQQALLRALSVRHIRALGSDMDTPFNVRVIAATNVDLLECAKNGTFREDLYYRLAVITITTPALRQRKEDIPALVRYFLRESAFEQNRHPIELSRGALDKLLQYDWPGNIREIKNSLTRAVTFADGDILLAEHLHLGSVAGQQPPDENGAGLPSRVCAEPSADTPAAAPTPGEPTALSGMNARQRKAWPFIIASGGTNRAQYQEAIGDEVSVRTAQYDLQDMVNKGLLIKSGRGPTSRYTLAPAYRAT